MKIKFTISLMLALIFCSSAALAATIYIPGDQPTIQAGIDAASEGDTVLVADGIFTGLGNKDLDFNGKAITVKSENGPNHTIIDCELEGRGFYFHSGEGNDSVVSGFTITNGMINDNNGGAIFIASASPSIKNCIIDTNSAKNGGGIAFGGNSSVIENCIIKNNVAADGHGGGLFIGGAVSAIINNCIIIENSASAAGGGVFVLWSSPTFNNCTFTKNLAQNIGGAIASFTSSSTILNNCILWENEVTRLIGEEIGLFMGEFGSSVTVKYSDVQGGESGVVVCPECTLNWGDGNINADPLFVDPQNEDIHLRAGSPCIDSGTSDGAPDTDLDGMQRPQGDGYDMGAYEAGPTQILLYGVNSADDGLSLIDPQTGEVTFIGPLDQDTDPNFNRFSTPVAMAVRPSDQKIFVWNNTSDAANTGDLLTVDPLTGAATGFVEVSGQPSFGALAFAPDGRLFAHWNQLFEINLLTGELSSIGSVGPSVSGAAFSPDGILWCAGLVSINGQVVSQLSTVDTSTGVRSVVAELDVDVGTIGSIVFDPSGTLIGSGFNGPLGNIIFDIDTIDGSVSNIRFITNGSSPQGMGFVSSTTLPNQPPEIDSFEVERDCSEGLLAVKFTCAANDPDGEIYSYTIDFGDDSPLETAYTQEQEWVFLHTYEQEGHEEYNVTCTVEDDDVATSTSEPTSYGENETHTGQIGVPIDSDGDSLSDCWELYGYDHNDDGIIDVNLPAMGASPTHKDVFVEIDYTYYIIDNKRIDDDKPKLEAIQKIVNAFKEQGINLHVDAGSSSLMDPNDPSTPRWGPLSESNSIAYPGVALVKELPDQNDADLSKFWELMKENFVPERRNIFHYCIFSHRAVQNINECPPPEEAWPSGWTEKKEGGYFVVSLRDHTVNNQAGTFMHELGHSLGLGPDGAPVDTVNPNYLSVMSYNYQLWGLRIDGEAPIFDYSRFELPPLNESGLNEQIGLRDLTDPPVVDGREIPTDYGILFWLKKEKVDDPDICNPDHWQRYMMLTALTTNSSDAVYPINWNMVNGIEVDSVQVDLNKNKTTNDQLRSWDDWKNLNFGRGGTGGFGAIEHPPDIIPIEDAIIEEITEEQISNLKHDYAVSLDISATEVVCPGATYTHIFTLENTGENSDTYSLTVNSLMGWGDLSSLPNVVSLNPGGKVSFDIPIHVPSSASPEDEERLNILATSQANDNLADSAEIVVKVLVDIEPPDISLTADPDTLWPPNHKMKPVTVTADASDNCDADPDIVLVSVISNEPDDAPGGGDGHTTNDIQDANIGTEDYNISLRAERSGGGDGRIYTITYEATDYAGNTTTAEATVTVPHDKGKKK